MFDRQWEQRMATLRALNRRRATVPYEFHVNGGDAEQRKAQEQKVRTAEVHAIHALSEVRRLQRPSTALGSEIAQSAPRAFKLLSALHSTCRALLCLQRKLMRDGPCKMAHKYVVLAAGDILAWLLSYQIAGPLPPQGTFKTMPGASFFSLVPFSYIQCLALVPVDSVRRCLPLLALERRQRIILDMALDEELLPEQRWPHKSARGRVRPTPPPAFTDKADLKVRMW
eukprot:scaffold34463_cov20-Tisochrysis_lutea.AAC.1